MPVLEPLTSLALCGDTVWPPSASCRSQEDLLRPKQVSAALRRPTDLVQLQQKRACFTLGNLPDLLSQPAQWAVYSRIPTVDRALCCCSDPLTDCTPASC